MGLSNLTCAIERHPPVSNPHPEPSLPGVRNLEYPCSCIQSRDFVEAREGKVGEPVLDCRHAGPVGHVVGGEHDQHIEVAVGPNGRGGRAEQDDS